MQPDVKDPTPGMGSGLQSPCPSASLSPPPLNHSPPLERNPWHARTVCLIYTCLVLPLTPHMVRRCHWGKRIPE